MFKLPEPSPLSCNNTVALKVDVYIYIFFFKVDIYMPKIMNNIMREFIRLFPYSESILTKEMATQL